MLVGKLLSRFTCSGILFTDHWKRANLVYPSGTPSPKSKGDIWKRRYLVYRFTASSSEASWNMANGCLEILYNEVPWLNHIMFDFAICILIKDIPCYLTLKMVLTMVLQTEISYFQSYLTTHKFIIFQLDWS